MRKKIILGILVMGVLALTACGAQGGEQSKNNESGNSSKVQSTGVGDADSDGQNFDEADMSETKEDKGNNKKAKISLETLDEYEVTAEAEFETIPIEGGVRILDYLGDSEVVVVPATINGEKVISIGKAFIGDSGVKAIKIADTVESIDNSVYQNSDLQYVKCGAGLKEIGNGAFLMTGLVEIELNEGLETIGPVAFKSCPNLVGIYIPESVTEIEATAFGGEYPEEFVIRGKAGSVAEDYANRRGFKFEAVD